MECARAAREDNIFDLKSLIIKHGTESKVLTRDPKNPGLGMRSVQRLKRLFVSTRYILCPYQFCIGNVHE